MEFNLKLTPEEVNLIGASLGKQPFDTVVAVIGKIRAQVMEQEKPEVKKK